MLTIFRPQPKARKIALQTLHAGLVAQARNPVFYAGWAVPDSLDGRFDMILLHAFAIMRRLAGEGKDARAFSQSLYDVMFTDIEQALRETGVGDLSIPRHVRRMMKSFNGRMAAYEQGLADSALLDSALRRNVYGTVAADIAVDTAPLADYLRMAAQKIESLPLAPILQEGRVEWPDPAAVTPRKMSA